MTIATLLKLLHVLAAFWFVAGLLGRWFTLAIAARTQDIKTVNGLGQLSARFENRMVIPGSFVVFAVGLVTAWAQGWSLLGFLEGGRSNWLLVSLVLYLSLIPIIPLIFLPRGKRFARALEDANIQGRVTPPLTAAFHDPIVYAAHVYELVAVALIIILMVTKPF